MNEQLIGTYQLKNTSLKDLGLTNGRGIIRYGVKQIESEHFEKLNDEFRLKIEKKLKLEESFKVKQQQQQLAAEKSDAPLTSRLEASSNPPERSYESYERQVEKRPRVEESLENKKKQGRLFLYYLIGFSIFLKYPYLYIDYERKPTAYQGSNLSENQFENKPVVNEFANFKFPEETKGKKLNDINELQQIEQLSKEACNRQPILYTMDKHSENACEPNNNEHDLPADFFDLTVNDLKFVLSDLKKVQNEDQPLMTKAMRELEQGKNKRFFIVGYKYSLRMVSHQ
jgi:hypothetical protein